MNDVIGPIRLVSSIPNRLDTLLHGIWEVVLLRQPNGPVNGLGGGPCSFRTTVLNEGQAGRISDTVLVQLICLSLSAEHALGFDPYQVAPKPQIGFFF